MVLAPGVSPAPSPCAAPGAGCEFPSLLLCCPARGLSLYSRYSMKRDCGTGPRVCIKQNAKPTVPAAPTLPVARCVPLFYNPCLSFGTLQPRFVTSGRSQVPPCASPCVVTCVSACAGDISAVPVCFPSGRCEELTLETGSLRVSILHRQPRAIGQGTCHLSQPVPVLQGSGQNCTPAAELLCPPILCLAVLPASWAKQTC